MWESRDNKILPNNGLDDFLCPSNLSNVVAVEIVLMSYQGNGELIDYNTDMQDDDLPLQHGLFPTFSLPPTLAPLPQPPDPPRDDGLKLEYRELKAQYDGIVQACIKLSTTLEMVVAENSALKSKNEALSSEVKSAIK